MNRGSRETEVELGSRTSAEQLDIVCEIHLLTSLLSRKTSSGRSVASQVVRWPAAMLITVLPLKFRLTQEIRAPIMRANSNFGTSRGEKNGRTGSAEDGRGGVAANDRRCCRSVCEQQYLADGTVGRSHQRRL